MPKQCRYCQKELGNAGALANHERACDSNPENASPDNAQQPQATQASQQQAAPGNNQLATPNSNAQAQPPATQQAQQGQGGLPANQGAQDATELAERGAEGARAISQLMSDDPADRAGAKEQMAPMAAGFVLEMFQNSAEADRQRAAQREQAQNNERVQRADPDYCPECGVEILNPPDGQFACPGCGIALESSHQKWNGPSEDV